MNWYKLSQSEQTTQVPKGQQSFDFMANQPEQEAYVPLLPGMEKHWIECSELPDEVENVHQLNELIQILKHCGAGNIDMMEDVPDQRKLMTLDWNDKHWVIDGINENQFDMTEAHDWLNNVNWYGRVDNYVTMPDFSKEFWEGVTDGTKVYHGTSEEKLPIILEEGLSPMYETRGMSNRGTGAAVFTSSEQETAQYYYPVVLEIDVGQMKKDGYMPVVSQEEPIAEGEALNALAWKIGLEDYQHEGDSSDGLDAGTTIFFGPIPPKYLRVIE